MCPSLRKPQLLIQELGAYSKCGVDRRLAKLWLQIDYGSEETGLGHADANFSGVT
jgi:hypothetical protein